MGLVLLEFETNFVVRWKKLPQVRNEGELPRGGIQLFWRGEGSFVGLVIVAGVFWYRWMEVVGVMQGRESKARDSVSIGFPAKS